MTSSPARPDSAGRTADRLLDAQVDYILGELAGDRLADNLGRDITDVLALAATMTLRGVVDVEQVKRTARRAVDTVGASPLVRDLVGALADASYELSAGDEFDLGDVVERESVEALLDKLLGMHMLHDRALERLTESPLVATLASRFVAKIVADFVQQNRARAEKVPGMSSLLSLGTSAASRVKSATDRHLEQFLGDAAGKGYQYALRRTNSAIRELIDDPQTKDAILEVWDIHAAEPISGLRDYLTQADFRELALLGHDLVLASGDNDYARQLLDECIDVVFARYGDHDLVALLAEVGISHEDLLADALAFAPPVIEAACADGRLAALIRSRLEPFFRSEEVRKILDEPEATSAR